MKRKIHVIPHSHWDREWYFTTSRSKVYLMNNLKEVLDTLSENEEFKYFMLDAQASLLDDYTKWRPQDIEQIKSLVKDKKLIIGPWYTQSDQLVISAESIVRNLYYGMRRCEEFGGYMNIAYVPDSFGQAGNMPQIYKNFGIEDTLFWRGVSDDMVSKTDFIWRGDDGSKVFATQIPFGYYIGGNIPEGGKEAEEFWEKECFQKAAKGSATRHIYFPNGFDQAPIRKNLPEIIKKRNFEDLENEYVISCIEDYMNAVKKEVSSLEEINGELLIAKHMRIHKSIFSSRSDLKILNTQVQNYVVRIMEPLLTLSYRLGNEYPKEAIAEVWKLLFENAAHDSIGSCISDEANQDVYTRYKQVLDIATNLVELHARLISTSIENKAQSEMTFTIFNLLPQTRNQVVEKNFYLPEGKFVLKDEQGNKIPYTILEKEDISEYVLSQTIRLNPSKKIFLPKKVYHVKIAIEATLIPAFGYRQIHLFVNNDDEEKLADKNCLENSFYQITVNKNGSLNIKDKRNGIVYKNQCVLLENGDDGDSFNYSPPRKDMVISSLESNATTCIKGSSLLDKALIEYRMKIPYDLNERAQKKTSVFMNVTLNVTLKKDDPVIDFSVYLNNESLSHRVCVVFDAQVATMFNYSDQQFGIIKRPNFYEKEMQLYNESIASQSLDEEKTKVLANWSNDVSAWQEPPIAIETMQSFVSLSDNERGIALIPKGVREYEVTNEQGSEITLTLFRTYGFMGKENLLYRPGRASGERIIETKDAQLLKNMEFNFGFYAYQTNFNESDVIQRVQEYLCEFEVYQYADFLNGRLIFSQEDRMPTLTSEFSLFSSDNKLGISAIKKCEELDGYIIRVYNTKFNQSIEDRLVFTTNIKEAAIMNLKEEIVKTIPFENNVVKIDALLHCKFVTIFVKL